MNDDESTDPKDYRQGFKYIFETYVWVWKELLGPKGRRNAKQLAMCLCAGNLAAMATPWLLGEMINAIETQQAQRVEGFMAGIAAILLIRRGIQHIESHRREVMIGTNQGTINDYANRHFFAKSLGQHLREHNLLSAGGMEKGRARAQDTINLLLTEGCEIVFLLLSALIALWFLNRLAGCVSSLLLVLHLAWSLYLNRRVAEVCVPLDAEFRGISRCAIERWEQVERVKTSGKELEECEHMARWWDRIILRDQKFWLWFCDQCSMRNLISSFALIGVMAWSVWQTWNDPHHIGRLFPLFIWMQTILDNIWRLGNLEHRVNWNLPSIQSLRKALTMPPDVVDEPGAQAVDTHQGVRIEFRDVSHTYRPSIEARSKKRTARQVLSNVNFVINPGESVALLGRSGAGKSTIMRLLQRGMDPDNGEILINGRRLRGIKLVNWLHDIGYIPQRPAVLDGSVRFNLTYVLKVGQRAGVSDERLSSVVGHLGLRERLEDGLDTLVGKSGTQVSGGEAQRIMVGGAVIKNPRFYLIDEATSSLDGPTERHVQRIIAEALKSGAGALIIAHRLSTVRGCDKFIVLRRIEDLKDGEGQIEAVARSFEELYPISPTFRQLLDNPDDTLDS